LNHLLASFPESVRVELAAETVVLSGGERLQEIHEPVRFVHFPHSALVAAVVPLSDGGEREAGVAGCEGAIGLDALWGVPIATARWVVQSAGTASRVEIARLRTALATSEEPRQRAIAFCRAFLAQVMGSVACNATHPAERRFARWLLMCSDRVPDRELALTHEFAAQMLGMSRSRVTQLARTLEEAGIVRTSRGLIRVTDRARLAALSCECYEAVRRTYELLLPYVPDCGHSMAPARGATLRTVAVALPEGPSPRGPTSAV
jgi:CRP-like cAMP-binding protein